MIDLGDERQHGCRNIEARDDARARRDAALEDLEPQFLFERAHLDHEPAREARTHAVVEAFEIGRRPVGRDHDLTAGVDQRVERVAELDLRRLALQELQVVDDQHVDAAQRFLEGERRLRFSAATKPYMNSRPSGRAPCARCRRCRPGDRPEAGGSCRGPHPHGRRAD